MTTATEELVYKKTGRIGVFTINRPDRRNTVHRYVATEMYHQLAAIADDPEVAVLIFRGEGKDFCAGADIVPADKMPGAADPGPPDMRQFDVPKLLHNMPAVTIAAIKGGCAGAGLGYAAACDFRVADPSAKFNTAFLDVGVAGDMGGPWLMSRIVGGAKARDLFFFPRKFESPEALEMGFINRLFGADEFEAKLQEMAETLANKAPLALAGLKQNFVEAEQNTLSSFIAIESLRHMQLFHTKDREEAFKAYLEKRQPTFIGR